MTQCLPKIQTAFSHWLDLQGLDRSLFDPDSDEQRTSWRLGELSAMERAVSIHDALLIPDDGLTAQMLIGAELNAWAEDRTLTMAELLRRDPKVMREQALALQIRTLLEAPDMIEQRAGFGAQLGAALAHYGAGRREDVSALLEDEDALAWVRRDAWSVAEQLHTHQFLTGDVSQDERPAYNTLVRAWRSVSDLLAAHTWLPEGVSLALVRPERATSLFFCFVVRRGGNLWLLHDAEEEDHPLQAGMRRRPDRILERRMARFRFPYETAGVKLEEAGRRTRVDLSDSQALALPEQLRGSSQPLCQMSELPADELAWLVLAIDRIVAHFWHSAVPQQALSQVAGAMATKGPDLISHAQQAGLPIRHEAQASPTLPALTTMDVAQAHLADDAERVLGETGDLGDRDWLVARYAHQVPETALNLIGTDADKPLQLTGQGQLQEVDEDDDDHWFDRRDNPVAQMERLDPTRIGDTQTLDADRKFVARANLARGISLLAQREFQQQQDEVAAWLAQAYSDRRDFLLTLAGPASRNELTVVDWPGGTEEPLIEMADGLLECRLGASTTGTHIGLKHLKGAQAHHALAVVDPDKDDSGGRSYDRRGAMWPVLAGKHEKTWAELRCPVTGAKPSLWLIIKPANAVELAWLLGVERETLPIGLRHYTSCRASHGNSILDRIDPMQWALDDPWDKLQKGVRIPLSKRGLAQLQKLHPKAPDLASLHGVSMAMLQGDLPAGADDAPTAKTAKRGQGRRR